MAQTARYIKVPPAPSGIPQTMPTAPEKRIANEDIKIERCTVEDAPKIAEGMYLVFPDEWWARMEPHSLRPPTQAQRETRFAKRLIPTFSMPHIHWIKAVHVPTSTVVGIAGWQGPGQPLHNILRRSAVDFYGWKESVGWTDEEVEDMWAGYDLGFWDGELSKNDVLRGTMVDGEDHWYLAPLFTWPDWQGRGVGKKLLDWAIVQADAMDPSTPMVLESTPHAMAVYMHVGFKIFEARSMIRRGPAEVRGLEAEEEEEEEEAKKAEAGTEKVDITVKENEVVNAVA